MQHMGAAAIDRLQDLGLDVDDIHFAVRLAYTDTLSCTELDAPGAIGYLFWTRTNRYFRERKLTSGWGYSNRYNILKTINPNGDFAITGISGRGGVGIHNRNPTCKNPKGTAVSELVQLNEMWQQPALFEIPVETLQPDEMPTWFLLYKTTDSGINLELSMPVQMHGKNVDTWGERIIIPPLPLDDPGINLGLIDDPTPNVDPVVDIEFRSAS